MLASVLIYFTLLFSSVAHAKVDVQSPLVELLQNVVKGFQDLDSRSKELVIEIPGIEQEAYFDLDSGEIFEPLQTTRVQIRAKHGNQDTALGKDATTADKLAEFGKALVKHKLYERGKNSEFMKWMLENAELSPLKLFVIKELLVLVDSIKKQDMDHLKIETICLLFRLSLTKDFELLDKNKTLTSHLPEGVRDALGAELCVYIDNAWTAFIRGTNNEAIKEILDGQKKNAGVTVQSFICRDEKLAHEVGNKFKSYSDNGFKKAVIDFIKNKDYQVVPYKEFAEGADDVADEDGFETKLVTFKSFGGISNHAQLAELPQEVRENMENARQFPHVMVAKNNHGEYCVCYLSDRLDLVDTAKLSLAALVKAVRSGAQKRQEYVRTHEKDVKEQRKAREEADIIQQKIDGFLRTEAGRASAQRIADALEKLENDVQPQEADAQELQAKHIQIQKEHDALMVEASETQQEIEKLEKRIDSGTYNRARLYQLMGVIKDLQQKLENFNKKIAEKMAEKSNIESQLAKISQEVGSGAQLTDLKKDLKELQVIEADQRRNNGQVAQDVLDEIATLKKEIGQREVQNESLEYRLAQRLKRAVIYNQEAMIMKTELAKARDKIDNIKDVNKRRLENVKFSHLKNFYHLYIQDLENKAKTVHKENELMEELSSWRQELRGTKMADIAKEDLERISFLEREVGFVLDNKQADGFVFKFMHKRPELREFLASYTNEKSPEAQELIDILSVVVKKSGHVQENVLVYRDAVRVFFPSFLPTFDKATGVLNKTYGIA